MLGSISSALLSPVIDPPSIAAGSRASGGVLQCNSHRLVNLVAAHLGKKDKCLVFGPIQLSSYQEGELKPLPTTKSAP